MPTPSTVPAGYQLNGLVERVTFFSEESGFCVLRIKAEGHRDLVTVVGSAPSVSAGEWITAEGDWVVVEISLNGQIVPGAGVSNVAIRGNVLSFTGTGTQYPSLRLDFGPSHTVRASTTMENALPPSRLDVTTSFTCVE